MKSPYALLCILLITACNLIPQPKEAPQKATIEELMNTQILLTNYADFTNDRVLNAASAFLIHYKDSVYAVTAKHLIGPDGGVEPAVELNQLSKELIQWKMYPRVPVHPATDTVVISAGNLNYTKSNSDALLLKTVDFHAGILPLQLNFNAPVAGDTLYIIGCPYSEKDCKQNLYKVVFREMMENLLISEIFSDVDMTGFSGAPVVNKMGEVVGIIQGSGEFEGKNFTSATSIMEIKKVVN